MARTVSEFSMCSPSGDTVKNPCISLTLSYSLCLGQRKREWLQSLETRLNARLGGTNAMYASGGEIPVQLQHPIQPPLLRPGNPVTPNEPLYDPYPDIMIGASESSYMCLAPYESACNTSESSSSYVRDQFGINTVLPYGMPWQF
jgi:hypothetical protein